MEGVIGEIRLWAASFAPKYWAFCDGRLVSISSNAALFSLLGTMYGGDGIRIFALPNLCGRVAVGVGQGASLPAYEQGDIGGVESVALTPGQLPSHRHLLQANNESVAIAQPGSAYPAVSSVNKIYGTTGNATMMTTAAGATVAAAHDNMMPFLSGNYIICMCGMYPYRP